MEVGRWFALAILLACGGCRRTPVAESGARGTAAAADRGAPDVVMTEKRFFPEDDFSARFGHEMASAGDVYRSLVGAGLKENRLSKLDFTFVSDERAKLERLRELILGHYPYTITGLERAGAQWELEGVTDELALTADHLLYWALDLYDRGYEHDARLEAYGTPFDPKDQRFPRLDASQEQVWFERGVTRLSTRRATAAARS